MTRVWFSKEARADLLEIDNYLTQAAGSAMAMSVVENLEAAIDGLRFNPELGQRDPRLGDHRRRLIRRPYLIIYETVDAAQVDVLRILHGARDLDAIFTGPSGD